jgi:hypothetical protein
MRGPSFVPDDFDPPAGLVTPDFVLEPLGPQYNERDYAAWTSSIEHILATPGIVQPGDKHPWPHPMAPEENLGDLIRHAEGPRPAFWVQTRRFSLDDGAMGHSRVTDSPASPL